MPDQTTALTTTVERDQMIADIKAVRSSICPKLSDQQIVLFAMICLRTGLSPFDKQIYAIPRGDRVIFQTGIDGFRSLAESSGQYAGQEVYWCGKDGKWVEVWLEDEQPVAAKVIVYRKDFERPQWAVARYNDYFVKENPLWTKMGPTMVAKCAEALVLRKTFPQQLSGLHTDDEMEQSNYVESDGPSQKSTDHRKKLGPDAARCYALRDHLIEVKEGFTQEAFDKLCNAHRDNNGNAQWPVIRALLTREWAGVYGYHGTAYTAEIEGATNKKAPALAKNCTQEDWAKIDQRLGQIEKDAQKPQAQQSAPAADVSAEAGAEEEVEAEEEPELVGATSEN